MHKLSCLGLARLFANSDILHVVKTGYYMHIIMAVCALIGKDHHRMCQGKRIFVALKNVHKKE